MNKKSISVISRTVPMCLRSRGAVMLSLACVLLCATTCQETLDELYEPVVTFKGYFNSEWIELPGHRGVPNTCELNGDTIVIFCYSDNFDKGSLYWNGYMLKMEIHPFVIDTENDFSTPHLRVRFSDFAVDQVQTTRVLYPIDTLYGKFTASGNVVSFQRRVDGLIDIDEIYLPLHNENQSGLALKVEQGELYGTVER